MKTPVAVFASGTGSNFQALVNYSLNEEASYEVVLLVCDKEGAPVLDKAAANQIPSLLIRPKDYLNKEKYEEEILRHLGEKGVKWIALAGYMRLIGKGLLAAYPDRIVNLHPSLLPSFPGKDAIGQAFAYGVKVTGVTLHLVDEGLDSGPILAQKPVTIHEGESLLSVADRIHRAEHLLYPAVMDRLTREGILVEGRKVMWLNAARGIEWEKIPEVQ